ncbi:MAG: hypothetical protein WCR54_06525 [Clostridia bacterium]
MLCSNNYKLECSNVQNAKTYRILHNISLILKIIAVLILIVMIWLVWFFAISIVIYISSIIIAYRAASMTYDYEYFIDANRLKVTKIYKNNKEITVFNQLICDLQSCERIQNNEVDYNSKNCWVVNGFQPEYFLKIKYNNEFSYIIADKYFYSLLMENK